ncbi:hypothetical protein DEA8626_03446 [Defluviimonas aquaemixtae]|uniref:Uncharacterized protein n=1 Tax=Albidovulum aquaemixtae TaxID=1542388 RepID=A0A2R8BLU2_9RHOB|nr:hypothetical protein DEA8626_03446 [Defluviimonas aquaemixtae]
METTQSIAHILCSVAAYAERNGLDNLQRLVSEAAIAAMKEIPETQGKEVLVKLVR